MVEATSKRVRGFTHAQSVSLPLISPSAAGIDIGDVLAVRAGRDGLVIQKARGHQVSLRVYNLKPSTTSNLELEIFNNFKPIRPCLRAPVVKSPTESTFNAHIKSTS
jgi:hypothetical protein